MGVPPLFLALQRNAATKMLELVFIKAQKGGLEYCKHENSRIRSLQNDQRSRKTPTNAKAEPINRNVTKLRSYKKP
jgi:hypothetical protein